MKEIKINAECQDKVRSHYRTATSAVRRISSDVSAIFFFEGLDNCCQESWGCKGSADFGNLTYQIERFLNPMDLISHIHMVESPQKVFIEGRPNLEGDWTKPQSTVYCLLLLAQPDNCSSRPLTGGRADVSRAWLPRCLTKLFPKRVGRTAEKHIVHREKPSAAFFDLLLMPLIFNTTATAAASTLNLAFASYLSPLSSTGGFQNS